MDTTILRLIIAAIGVMVVLGIYLWDYFRRKKTQEAINSKPPAKTKINSPDESGSWVDVKPSKTKNDTADLLDFDPLAGHPETLTKPERPSIHPTQAVDEINPSVISTKEPDSPAEVKIPVIPNIEIIQFSLVPKKPAESFPGDKLLEALTEEGLEYGDPGIFHRYLGEKDNRECIFSIVSLVEPGTFPIDNMDAFQCPGITLFLQTTQVSNPLEAFDDLTSIGHLLSYRLFGKLLDAQRHEVTMDDIEPIRNALKVKLNLS